MSDQIIRFENVVKSYPGAVSAALDVSDFSINRGEFFSILGPSGSGKTTALRLIAGFEEVDSGRIFLDTEDVTQVPPNKRNINTVFQSYALFPHMSLWDNVAYPLKMARTTKLELRRRVDEALDMVAMTKMAERYPHQVSGGQRQRVALARAFVARPKVLLLDEPLSALDLNLRLQMQHVLVELQRRIGITFIYVTHDQGEALSMSSRVAIINGGRIQQLGTPNSIYYQPNSRFVAQFIGKSNLVAAEVSHAGSGSAMVSVCGESFSLPAARRNGPTELAVRFESLSVTASDEAAPHAIRLRGQISDVLFLGHACEVKVRCQDQELIAFTPARKDSPLKHGQHVCVSFNPEDCAVFHD
ncbi:ABC transporter ATP-binding protein [Paraburkholderia bannensis]|uniref:ABC transporter ATP-binding protein n=1 Tax=Paraburkholderia bannensis TaxID=765414 RepID=UPI002AC32C86|nr:ABC transporter ATP-binding protein [Paraburkholderia bannensis]